MFIQSTGLPHNGRNHDEEIASQAHTAGRPAGGGGLTKQRIAEVALAQIDEFGLGAFSMREVAARLDVYPATVHWHVSTREALLAEVAATVMAEVTPPPGKLDWQAWITELFRRCRTRGAAPPRTWRSCWSAQLVSNGSLPIELVEGVLAALTEADFEGEPLLEAYNCVVAAMLGFLTMEFSPCPWTTPRPGPRSCASACTRFAALDHPVLTRNLAQLASKAFILRWDNGTTVPLDSSFERHIQITIDGLEAFARKVRAA